MWERIRTFFQQNPRLIMGMILVGFVMYGSRITAEAIALPTTEWMRIFSHRDFQSWPEIFQYLKELRTGIPPILSFLELWAYLQTESLDLIIRDLYQIGMILGVLLPYYFTKMTWRDLLINLGMAVIMMKSTLVIHKANAQLYDVLLPVFLLLYLLCARWSFSRELRPWLGITLAILAGFFLSMAELSRPFMIAIVPILIGYNFFHYRKGLLKRFVWFMLPVLIISGGWHAKLLIYNDGQVIWSNHGGTNLFRAWIPVIDQEKMKPQLKPEAPPLNEYGWAWDNINTQIHAENSAVRKEAVVDGVLKNPAISFKHFMWKVKEFTYPQTGMYDYNPTGRLMTVYRWLVRLLFGALVFLLIRSIVKGIKDKQYWTSEEFAVIFLTFFLCFIPIIGESGEESRFLISVLPFLMLMGLYVQEIIWDQLQKRFPHLFPTTTADKPI